MGAALLQESDGPVPVPPYVSTTRQRLFTGSVIVLEKDEQSPLAGHMDLWQ